MTSVLAVSFSPNGKQLATASLDGTAKVKADLEQIKVDMIIPGKSRPSHSKQFFDPKGGGAAEYLIPWKACNSGRYKRRIL
jgi:WD40 repeat protein